MSMGGSSEAGGCGGMWSRNKRKTRVLGGGDRVQMEGGGQEGMS